MQHTLTVFIALIMLALLERIKGSDPSNFYNPLAPNIDPVLGNRGLMIDAGSSGKTTMLFLNTTVRANSSSSPPHWSPQEVDFTYFPGSHEYSTLFLPRWVFPSQMRRQQSELVLASRTLLRTIQVWKRTSKNSLMSVKTLCMHTRAIGTRIHSICELLVRSGT